MVQLSSYSVPIQGIHHEQENVHATVESSEIGVGTLYVTESNVVWLNQNQDGVQLEYKLISLHAISRDLQTFPKEHLLVHYDAKLPYMNSNSADESEEEEGEPEMYLTQIRFAPEDSGSLDMLFSAMSECQTLHPDSDCQLSDEEFNDAEENGIGDGFYHDESGFANLNEEGRANLERMNQMLQGQGDADLAARTNQLTLMNGHVNGENDAQDQFQDADDMDNE